MPIPLVLRRARRALSVPGILALVAVAAMLVGAGYILGNRSARTAKPAPAPGAASTVSPASMATEDGLVDAKGRPLRPDGTIDVERFLAQQERRAEPAPPRRSSVTPGSVKAWRFDPPELDFGRVAVGTPLKGSFSITNVSRAPLRILAMKPDCKCTTVTDLSGRVLEPGERIEIPAEVEAKSYPSETTSGIKFVFEGGQSDFYRMRTVVTRAVQALPPYVQTADALFGTLTVTSTDGRPFRVLSLGGEPPAYAPGEGTDPAESRTAHVLQWDLTGFDPENCLDASGRPMPKWLVVETDHPEAPLVDVRVRHVPCTLLDLPKNGRLWFLSENRVVLGNLETGRPAEFEVELDWLRDNPPNDTIREVVSESPQFDASLVETRRDGDVITCRVRVVPRPGAAGLIYGDVRFVAYTPAHSQVLTVIGRIPVEPAPGA